MASENKDKTDVYPHPSCISSEELLQGCDVKRTRASGPGGQHRNKVETAIEMTHRETGIVAIAYERRSQEQNRKVALHRLRELLAIEHRTVVSEVVEPSVLWNSRCRGGKIQCNDQHTDFPAMLAEAMNAVSAKDYDVRPAAAALGCSSSQLIRFLARHPSALTKVNVERMARGLKKLHS